MAIILETELLDKVFHKWRYSKLDHSRYPMRYLRNHRDQRFESWLWDQGFTVIQQNKKRYLKFDGDERRLTLFLLKWT